MEYSFREQTEILRKATINTILKVRIENDGSGNPIYVGEAAPGVATSDPLWRIKKLTHSGSSVTQVDFADGVAEFTKVWDDRATYTYG